MGQDNNSPTENVHITTSGTLGHWREKIQIECTFYHKHTQTWDKTTTHQLRICNVIEWNIKSMDRKTKEIHALYSTKHMHAQIMG